MSIAPQMTLAKRGRREQAGGGYSVMAARHSDPRALDLFPTPPWATRALVEDVLGKDAFVGRSIWEPAAGLGTMSDVLEEYTADVFSSDVHDYGGKSLVGSFVGEGADVVHPPFQPDWVITNPPFNLALEFTHRGLCEAKVGVAMLVRSVWAEGGKRYQELFRVDPPSVIAQFCERVPMVAGRWDPKASTATSYAWFIWQRNDTPLLTETKFKWIPPGARARHTRHDDVARFASIQEV